MKEFIEIKGKIKRVTFVANLKKNDCAIWMYEVEVNFDSDCEPITEFKFNCYIDCTVVKMIGKKLTEEVIEACRSVGWPV